MQVPLSLLPRKHLQDGSLSFFLTAGGTCGSSLFFLFSPLHLLSLKTCLFVRTPHCRWSVSRGGERWMCSPSTPTCPPTVSLSLDTSLQAAKDGGGLAEGWAGTARSILSALGLVWDQMLVHTRHLVRCFVLLCVRSSEMSSPTASMFCSHEKGMPNLLLLLPSLPFASVAEEGDWGRLWCCSRW